MNFQSDNTSIVAPQVIEAILNANHETALSYGQDAVTQAAKQKFNQIFERDVEVFFTSTGTAANGLALATLCPPYGAIFAHEEAHIITDEANAVEGFTGGAKIIPLKGQQGKIDPGELDQRIHTWKGRRPHSPLPAVLSLTQATETGTVYTVDEIKVLSKIAKENGLYVHMDGARFANALVSLGETAAAVTWKAGVDVLSVGGTKNGAMAAEAVVFFNHDLSKNADYVHKRMGQLFSKMRFFSSQFLALFDGDLWLRHAYNANQLATQVAEILQRCEGVKLLYPVEVNEIFAIMPARLANHIRAQGITFYDWGVPGQNQYRFVTSFNTHSSAIESLKIACKANLENSHVNIN
ncbi:MAG: low specificity L-threonine aldolase [Candidatus Paracaedibacteraceae bacterium]|nr:low specificity L-threonine aldolase [Candidatus Paracaedibacteraceae bacterium]